jgi:hypothetical protein
MEHRFPSWRAALTVGIGLLILFFTIETALATTPKACWSFENNWTDEFGGYSATATGANFTSAGKVGYGSLYTSGQYVDTNFTFYAVPDYVVSFWAYPTGSTRAKMISARVDSNNIWMDEYHETAGSGGLYTIFGGSVYGNIRTNTVVTPNIWYHIVLVGFSNDTMYAYVNGTYIGSSTSSGKMLNDLNAFLRFGLNDGTGGYAGVIDEVHIWNSSFSSVNVTDDYNAGAGRNCSYYIVVPPSINTYTVHVADLFDNGNLAGVNVTLGGLSNTTDASGNALFYNLTGSQNYNATKALYFTVSGSVAANATSTANMTEAEYNVTSITEVITGNTIGGAYGNWTAFVTGGRNYSGNGATYPLNIHLRDGANTLLLTYTGGGGYYNATKTVTVTGPPTIGSITFANLSNARFNVTARDIFTNASVNSFNITANASGYSWTASNTTTNGSLVIMGAKNVNTTFFIDASGYAYANTSTTPTSTVPNVTFYLYTQNSILITFTDEYTGNPILANVTVELTLGVTTTTGYGINGSFYYDLLTPGNYTVTLNTDGYDERNYFVVIAAKETTFLDAYLLNTSLSQDTVFHLIDTDGNYLPDATITIQDFVNGSWVTIAAKMTDFMGIAYFPLQYAHTYRGTFEAASFDTKTAEFERVLTDYYIRLSASNTQEYTPVGDEYTYNLTPSGANLAPGVISFTISTSSPTGALSWFAVRTLFNGTTNLTNTTGSPGGGTATVTLNLTGATGHVVTAWYMGKSAGTDTLVVRRDFLLYVTNAGNYSLFYFADTYTSEWAGEPDQGKNAKALLVVSSSVGIAAVLAAFTGVIGAIIGAAAGLIVGGAIGWLNWSLVILSAGGLLLSAFVLGRS